jgi:ATP-dependent DNA helicase RecG
MRGPGEFFGTDQSGFTPFKIGNMVADIDIIREAKELASEIVKTDPGLYERLIENAASPLLNFKLAEV